MDVRVCVSAWLCGLQPVGLAKDTSCSWFTHLGCIANLVTNLSNFALVARAHTLNPCPFSNFSSKIILTLSQPQCVQNQPTRTQDIHTCIQSLMLQPSLRHSAANSRVQNALCGARRCVHDVLEHGHLCWDLGTQDQGGKGHQRA